MITPCDNAKHSTHEDHFNYHLSTFWIFVEYAFYEIDACWGIFWSGLRFKLQHNLKVIDAAIRLCNFIVSYNLEVENRFLKKGVEFNNEVLRFIAANPNEIVGIFSEGTNTDNLCNGGSNTCHVREWKARKASHRQH